MSQNFLNIYKESNLNRQNINKIHDIDGFGEGEDLEDLKITESDEEIIRIVKGWKTASDELNLRMKEVGDRNYRYYIGNFADYLPREYLQSIDNRIFTSLETVVPIATSKPAQPVVYPGTNTDDSKELANMHQKVLLTLFKKLNIQQITEALVRHNQFYRLGVLKYGIKDGKIATDFVIPTRLWIDPNATCADDCEFIGEAVQVTAKDLIEYFPNKKEDIMSECQGKTLRKLQIMEWWSQDMVVITLNEKYVLKKIKNPLFSYEKATDEKDEFGNYILEDYRYNYFDKPKVPYIFLQVFNSGLGVIDDTTPLEQSIPLQDQITKLMMQIHDNAEIVGNPILKAQGFKKEQIDQINQRRVGDAIGVTGDQDLEYLQPGQLPSYIINQIESLQAKIDDIFGTHPTTRGEREAQETLGGRELLRQGDEDRQSTIGRGIERVLQELYRAWTHLIKVYYDEKTLMPDLTSKGAEEYIEISRDNIEDGIEIYVVAGSTLPDDKISKRKEALDLWMQGAITIEKLYENMGWDNPSEEAIKFKLDQLETQLINSNAQQLIEAYGMEGKMLSPKMLAQIILAGGIGDTMDESDVNTSTTGLEDSSPVGSEAVNAQQ